MARARLRIGLAGLVAAVALGVAAGGAHADERDYAVFAPPGLKTPAPTIVVLHCYSCMPEMVIDWLRLEDVARAHGVMLAMPFGHVDQHGNPFWNATPACCDFDSRKPDDVAYVAHVIDDLVRHKGADPKRIYLVGISNGGFFAYRLACELGPKIAAIVSIGGGGPAPAQCRTSAPVAVLHIHGDADSCVPIGGGLIGDGLPQRAPIPAARTTLADWARRDSCSAAPTPAAPIDLDASLPGAETRVERWRCAHAAVEQWTVHGGPHVPHFAPDAGERIWQFLAAQHR